MEWGIVNYRGLLTYLRNASSAPAGTLRERPLVTGPIFANGPRARPVASASDLTDWRPFTARPAADAPSPTAAPSDRTASVKIPLAPPVPLPEVELRTPPTVSEAPAAPSAKSGTVKPVVKKARTTKAKAKKRVAKRKPILRPFINIKKRPTPVPVAPVRAQPVIPFTPRGRAIQLGAYSTEKQAEAAYRMLIWRHPYLKTKPKVIAPTQPLGGWRYYRLRLGTETQAQSAVICQRLQARGQSCIVIY